MKSRPQRRSTRLPDYDYSRPGAYYVTICTYQRECLFGEIQTDVMELSAYGRMVQDVWLELPTHYPHVHLDYYVVMPNHIHGIIVLNDAVTVSKRHALPEIVRGFKTYSAKPINSARGETGVPVWQRSFYEHVIRNDDQLNRIREYIINNPAKWGLDQDNPTIYRQRPQ